MNPTEPTKDQTVNPTKPPTSNPTTGAPTKQPVPDGYQWGSHDQLMMHVNLQILMWQIQVYLIVGQNNNTNCSKQYPHFAIHLLNTNPRNVCVRMKYTKMK